MFRETFFEEEGNHHEVSERCEQSMDMAMYMACLWDGEKMMMVTSEVSWDCKCLLG